MAEDRDRAFVKNAADPRQVKDAGRKAKRAREEEVEDVAVVVGTERGRGVVLRVLSDCGLFTEVFDPDAHRTAFNAGVRNVGLFLHAEISAADEMAFFLMMKEARDRQTKQGDEAQAAHTPSADQGDDSAPDL